MWNAYHINSQHTELKSIKFVLITVDTTSIMMTDFAEEPLYILISQVIIGQHTY